MRRGIALVGMVDDQSRQLVSSTYGKIGNARLFKFPESGYVARDHLAVVRPGFNQRQPETLGERGEDQCPGMTIHVGQLLIARIKQR